MSVHDEGLLLLELNVTIFCELGIRNYKVNQ